jgi:WD40 repeat protein
MLQRNQSFQNQIRNSEAGPQATPVRAGRRRLALLCQEQVLFAMLLGTAALIFLSAHGDPPAESSPALVAKCPTGLVEALAFSPDGKTLASSGQFHSLSLWNMENVGGGVPILPTIPEHATAGLALAFSPDGNTLVVGGERSLVIWSYEAGQCTLPRQFASETVRCLAFSADGRTLALGCDDGSVRLWDMPAARERAILEAHVDVVRSVCFSPDGRRLVSSGQDRLVMLWDTEESIAISPLGAEFVGHNAVRFAAFSPDGAYVAIGEVDGCPTDIILLHAETGEFCSRLTGMRSGINALAFSPDGQTLATAGIDRRIKFWDIVQSREQTTVSVDIGFVKSLAFSPDGAWLAWGGFDETVKIWDIKHAKAVVLGQAGSTIWENQCQSICVPRRWVSMVDGRESEAARFLDSEAGRAEKMSSE